jgi:Putative Actinobacterial Holin-X, holin superfamily III
LGFWDLGFWDLGFWDLGFGFWDFVTGIRIALCVSMANPDYVQESIGSLIRGILTDVQTLIREEIALARVEIREQAGRARAAALSFGIAAAALAFGAIFLLVAIALGIASLLGWPAWTGSRRDGSSSPLCMRCLKKRSRR